jgi:2-oxoisovalerate dehydrogenase E1 component
MARDLVFEMCDSTWSKTSISRIGVSKLPGSRPTYRPAQSSTVAIKTSAPCGLQRTALRADDRVLFLEHKRLYREPHNRSAHPGAEYTILLQNVLLAATQIERRDAGVSIEIIDLRTLAPYDWEAIRASVEKTSRVMVVHEDCLVGVRRGDRGADRGRTLRASGRPMRRVGALDTWVGYHPQLEAAILPQTDNLMAEMGRLLGY